MVFIGASCDHLPMADVTEHAAQAAFRDAQERWRDALAAHRLAPPDAGFSARLSALAVRRARRLMRVGWRMRLGLSGRPIEPRRARRRMSSNRVQGGEGPRSCGGVSTVPSRR